jgi:hypothetical protein
MAVPPGSAAALVDQIGSTYQREDAANGLSARPPVVELLLDELLLELEELEELELLEDELEELELLEDDELELEELLLDDELELLLDDEELDELLLEEELLELLDDELELEELPLIDPVEAVRVTRSSLEPSSLLRIRSVCEPAARLLKVAGVMVP